VPAERLGREPGGLARPRKRRAGRSRPWVASQAGARGQGHRNVMAIAGGGQPKAGTEEVPRLDNHPRAGRRARRKISPPAAPRGLRLRVRARAPPETARSARPPSPGGRAKAPTL
jgi:hypothetical protein